MQCTPQIYTLGVEFLKRMLYTFLGVCRHPISNSVGYIPIMNLTAHFNFCVLCIMSNQLYLSLAIVAIATIIYNIAVMFTEFFT